MAKMLSNFVQILCKKTPFCIVKNYVCGCFLRMQGGLRLVSGKRGVGRGEWEEVRVGCASCPDIG